MIVKAKGYSPYMTEKGEKLKFKDIKENDENYNYIKAAVYYGILDNNDENFNSDSKISREEMAKLLVKLMGYEKVGQLNDIYNLSFKDSNKVTSEYKGYVALCKGFGIIQGSNGYFKPKDNATMLDMSLCIYKAMDTMK